jgi:hypothetical protein
MDKKQIDELKAIAKTTKDPKLKKEIEEKLKNINKPITK